MSGYATTNTSTRVEWDASIARQVKRTRRETLEEVEALIDKWEDVAFGWERPLRDLFAEIKALPREDA